MLRVPFLMFFLASAALLSAGEPFYPVADIPEHLCSKADAVIRLETTVMDLTSVSGARLRTHKVVTVLNEHGIDYGIFSGFYDQYITIAELSIRIYDKHGELIEKIKDRDVGDYSAVAGFSLYDDNRIRYFKPYVNSYPFTVEFMYTYTLNGLAYLPPWMPQEGNNVSVEHASLELHVSDRIGFHNRQFNVKGEPAVSKDGDISFYRWEVEDELAFELEPLASDFREFLPLVYIFPGRISLDGYTRQIENWNDLGAWVGMLNAGQGTLPEECKTIVQDIVSSANGDTLEMIRGMYRYLQGNTRYVSIQLGIGGYRPFDAESVYSHGYGDCKALSNYMVSMLREGGIRAGYTLVSAGRRVLPVMPDMPGLQFNHVIVNVPVGGDTIWLECTSQDTPFGYLGSFTDDRYGLVITEAGGRLVKIPEYKQSDNIRANHTRATISNNGDATLDMEVIYNGVFYDQVSGFLNEDVKDQRKWILENLWLNNFKLQDFSLEDSKTAVPAGSIHVVLNAENYASVSGSRMFIKNTVFDPILELPVDNERKTDMYLRHAASYSDTVIYSMGQGWLPESIPGSSADSRNWGSYSLTAEVADGGLVITRNVLLNKGTYPGSDYEEFRAFFKAIQDFGSGPFVYKRAD